MDDDRSLDKSASAIEAYARKGGAEIVAREAELDRIGRFLDDVSQAPNVLVLQGEPGIGKTTLWTAGVRAARERGYIVLAARPAESETQLAFAALGDLLGAVAADVLDELPLPQRRALEVALLLSEPEDAAPDQRAIAAGLLSALAVLSGRSPVVVAVDDVQWLDASSANVLEFALRRVRDDAIGILLSWRSGVGDPLPLSLEDASPDLTVRRVEVGPLGLGAIHDVVGARVGVAFPRPVLRQIVETSGGNPFFAVGLAQALQRRRSRVAPGEVLPVPVELRALVTDRLGALPERTRDALVVAAALSKPLISVLRAVLGDEPEPRLAPALEAGVIECDGDSLVFTHPLLASVAYTQAPAAQRAELHCRLAALVVDPEERARHLALATEGPDEGVALALEEGARSAHARGATHAAVELCARARQFTLPKRPDDERRRAAAEAEYRILAGDAAGAREVLEGFVATCPAGHARAELLRRLGDACLFGLDWRSSADFYRQALGETRANDAAQAKCELGLTVASQLLCMPPSEIGAHARAAADLAERSGDRGVLAEALAAQALSELWLGHPSAWDLVERACGLEPWQPGRPISTRPSEYSACMLGLVDDFEAALAGYEEDRRQAREHGDEGSQAWILSRISQLECLTGAWDEAIRHVRTGEELLVQAGQPANAAFLLASRALIEAHLGPAHLARATGEAALELAGHTNALLGRRIAAWALGLLALSLEQPADAHAYLGPLVAEMRAAGMREPGEMRFVPDDVEALVALGALEEAQVELAWFEGCAFASDRASARAAAARCRGLIASQAADLTAAVKCFHESLRYDERVPMPFARARTLLALGTAQRRSRERRAARESLQQALDIFERLGAAVWAKRTRAELARIAGRAPGSGELTTAERRVAELVAAGRTNKEVAAELVVTVRTVESTLTKAYAKLGVRSRTQLARRLQ